MKKNQETKENICALYASDYHFEMVSLPYIEKELEGKKKVFILTENNLEDTIETLISRMNLEENKKNKILNINWKNEDLEKFKEIKNENKEMTIFIKGTENYIKNINRNIEKWVDTNEVKIVDCYDIEEVGDNLKNIMNKYNKVLGTAGVKEI